MKDLFGEEIKEINNLKKMVPQERKKNLAKDEIQGYKKEIMKYQQKNKNNLCIMIKKNISLFDPVISQLCYDWFCVKGGHVIDCCAGDTRKGNVIAHLGGTFTGIELRKEQVEHNNIKAENGAKWICDNGENILNHINEKSADMLLSCPPYFNLEVYSELENDISNSQNYDIFINSLKKMYIESIKCLKEDSFACIIIQNIRKVKSKLYIDYYPFKEDIIKIFTENGMFFYNDIVILKANGTAQMRAIPYMNQKKIVPIHEYLLVFYKGNFKNIKKKYSI